MIPDNATLTRRESALFTTVEDSVLMIDVDSGAYYELEGPAARIWELLDSPISFLALCDRLGERYNVDQQLCRSDTERFLGEMSELGLVGVG